MLPKVEGEVERWELETRWRGFDSWEEMRKHPEGDWVRAEDYAAMAEHAAMVEMERDALRDEIEAHKRSRQIDANEARSREQELCAEVERLRMAEAEAMAVVYSLEGTVERLRATLGKLVTACTPIDAEPNARGEIRSVRTPEWDVVAQARAAFPTGDSLNEGG